MCPKTFWMMIGNIIVMGLIWLDVTLDKEPLREPYCQDDEVAVDYS